MLVGGRIFSRSLVAVGLFCALSVGSPSSSLAEDAAPVGAAVDAKAPARDPEPSTTKDPQIALDDLELLLEPMTKDETEVEAKGWYALLRAKEREITAAELDVRRKNREIAQLEKQKTAAADLAKATEEVKAAGDQASDKDKEAAAKHLAEAQKNLTKTVETAKKETAKEEKKAEAATTAMAKQAEAAPPPATVDSGSAAADANVAPAASDKSVLQKAAESAAKKSEGTGDGAKVEKVVAATEKEAAAADQIKTLAESTPAAAGSAVAAAANAPGAATTAVAETSKKAEKLAQKADEATAAKTDVKVQLVDYSTQLMGERTALTDRLKLALDKLEAKGGDGKPYRLYIASIGGIKIDVTDRTATMARISGWLSSEEGGLRIARDIGTFLAYIFGSIIAARIVRMILRRVMSGDRMTSQLLRDFIVTSSRTRHCRDRVPVGVVRARGEPCASAGGHRRGRLRRRLRVAGHAQQLRQRAPHHGVQAVRRRRRGRSWRRHQGQGDARDDLQHLHPHR